VNIYKYLEEKKAIIDKLLDFYLPKENIFPEIIHKAMRYTLFSGGKRFRGILSIAASESVGGDIDDVFPVACSIELIHTYSLIHDDLPVMDNDDMRRGKPANHKVFGEAVAILAGDALLTEAFKIMSEYGRSDIINKIIYEISMAIGSRGMIGGQVLDIESQGNTVSPSTLEYIHRNKTGALILASVKAGGILGGANESQLKALTDYGENIGLAFQIKDDILDLEGEKEKLGKYPGVDVLSKKITFPLVFGIEESKSILKKLIKSAIKSIESFNKKGLILKELAKFIEMREF
jgi:geranylgeranyl diphosphate synthase type II